MSYLEGRYLAATTMQRPFNVEDFETFVAVYEARAFARAGKTLNTVQSNVSARIRNIEKLLGAELFVRERHGVRPTVKANQLYGIAKRVIALADEAADTVNSSKAA